MLLDNDDDSSQDEIKGQPISSTFMWIICHFN